MSSTKQPNEVPTKRQEAANLIGVTEIRYGQTFKKSVFQGLFSGTFFKLHDNSDSGMKKDRKRSDAVVSL